VNEEEVKKIKDLKAKGVGISETEGRFYPEGSTGAQMLGFVGEDEKGVRGRYGIEESFDELLRGVKGEEDIEQDRQGKQIVIGKKTVNLPEQGATIILTIDRGIEFYACKALKEAVKSHGADEGSVIVLEPATGKILAMCSEPDFDPNSYQKARDLSIFNNQTIFAAWEPGSIFKTITMAAAIDAEKITPNTWYEDKGFIKIPPFTIKNADDKTYGKQDMFGVLENSINTGAVFAAQKLGPELFLRYVENFGFGDKTGIELPGEAGGNISSLLKSGEIYSATASFGHGLTVTPLQMALAYGAVANNGFLMKPYIVEAVKMPDGEIIHSSPQAIRRVIEEKTSLSLKAMLAAVVKEGHGRRAAVSGYTIGGKTGTAQVAKKNAKGYEENATIGSFAGFGPVENPKFVIVARLDNPKGVIWAESSAAPLFGKIAKFLLDYLQIPKER
jgi:cell division protein FtsI/penicillin-binding protein 2